MKTCHVWCSWSKQASSQRKQRVQTQLHFQQVYLQICLLEKRKSQTTTEDQCACRIILDKNPSNQEMVSISLAPGIPNHWLLKTDPAESKGTDSEKWANCIRIIYCIAGFQKPHPHPRQLYTWFLNVQRELKEFHYERGIRWKFLIPSHKQYRSNFKIFCFKHAFNLCSGNQIMLLR